MNVRKYLQCSLRDLLWLIVLAAAMACWYRYRISLDQRVAAKVAESEAAKALYQKKTKDVERFHEFARKFASGEERSSFRPNDKDEYGRTFLGSTTSSTKTRQDLEDENKEFRLKVRELEKEIAELKSQ